MEIETEYTVKYMETAGIDPQKESPITSEFSHIMNKALFESFFEVVRHNMPKDEALRYIDMLAKYHCAGWRVIYEKDWNIKRKAAWSESSPSFKSLVSYNLH